jgi:hypothetical protein
VGKAICNSEATINSCDVMTRIAELEGNGDNVGELAALRDAQHQYLTQGLDEAWVLGATLLRENLLENVDPQALKGRYKFLEFDGVRYFFLSYEGKAPQPDPNISTVERINQAATALYTQGGDTAVNRWKAEKTRLVSNARYHLQIAQLKLFAADELEQAEELHMKADIYAAIVAIITSAKPTT